MARLADAPLDRGAGPPSNVFLTVSRIDWNATDRTSVYGRFASENEDDFQGRSVVPYTGYAAHSKRFNRNALVSATHAFTGRFVTQTKVTFNRLALSIPFGERPVRPTLDGGFGFAGVGVGLPGYVDGGGVNGTQNVVQFYEDASLTFGRHQMRFGGSFDRILDHRSTGLGEVGYVVDVAHNGVDGLHIPYKGGAPAVNDLLGGMVEFSFQNVNAVLQHIRAGKLRAIAVTGNKRSAVLPDVPTLEEGGVKDAVVYSWQGFAAPKGLPAAVKKRISDATVATFHDPAVAKRMSDQGIEVVVSTPEQTTAYQAAEFRKWKDLIEKRKITAD